MVIENENEIIENRIECYKFMIYCIERMQCKSQICHYR